MSVAVIEKLQAADHVTILDWWRHRGIELKIRLLPEETYLARVDGKPLLCVSFCAPCFGLAWIEAFVSDPKSTDEEREEPFKALYKFVEIRAIELGAERLFFMSPSPAFTKKYEAHGFKKTATVETMIKELE